MEQTVDYYKILQVRQGADKAAIISSYRRLCKLYHPDVNRAPEAEELMKQINLAYYVLCDDLRRKAYHDAVAAGRQTAGPAAGYTAKQQDAWRAAQESSQKAAAAMQDYFDALQKFAFEKAYQMLSLYDRQYVTQQSFCKWRKSVNSLFSIREVSIRPDSFETKITLEDGRTVPAKKLYINMTEKNNITQVTERYQITKHTILEHGVWRVFLGYRDLNEIAKVFENLSAQQEQGEMAKHWENYCSDTCRALNMLSLSGFLKETKRELYRHERYRQPLAVACFRLKADGKTLSEDRMSDVLECAAKTIDDALRETDIPAYTGDGVFAILFVEMKKKNAGEITQRLADKIKRNLHQTLGANVTVEYAAEAYEGGSLGGYLDIIAKNFRK